MTRHAVGRAAVLLVLLSTACTPTETACTLIGSVSGVSVTVDRAVAPDLKTLAFRVCYPLDAASPPRCRDASVRLDPGTDSVNEGCDPGGPDAACSATVVPNGSKVGFVQLDDLPEGRVSVAATATISGRRKTFSEITVPATTTYPNGPNCGGEGRQAAVTLRPDGLH